MKRTPLARTVPLRRTPMRKVERRDCRLCGRRVERRDGGWAHVRTPLSPHQPIPYATKRTPKRTSLMRQADRLWSQAVKATGDCAAAGVIGFGDATGLVHISVPGTTERRPAMTCFGPLDAAHVVPRRHRSTCWLLENGRPLCRAHHDYFGRHESAWRRLIGPAWDELWDKAQVRWDGDYAKVIKTLKGERE